MTKKKANDARRHKERMKTDLDFRLQRLLNCIRHRCLSGKGRKDQQYYLGLPVTITVEDLKKAWHRDGAASMRRPDVDRKEGHLGYTPENIQFLEHADKRQKDDCNAQTTREDAATGRANRHPTNSGGLTWKP